MFSPRVVLTAFGFFAILLQFGENAISCFFKKRPKKKMGNPSFEVAHLKNENKIFISFCCFWKIQLKTLRVLKLLCAFGWMLTRILDFSSICLWSFWKCREPHLLPIDYRYPLLIFCKTLWFRPNHPICSQVQVPKNSCTSSALVVIFAQKQWWLLQPSVLCTTTVETPQLIRTRQI